MTVKIEDTALELADKLNDLSDLEKDYEVRAVMCQAAAALRVLAKRHEIMARTVAKAEMDSITGLLL